MRALLVSLLFLASTALGQTPPEKGTVSIVAAVVMSDLSVRPVPRLQLQVFHEPRVEGDIPVVEVITSFDGKVSAALDAGKYRLVSSSPVTFDGQILSWEIVVEVVSGAALRVELSNDNAKRSVARSAESDPSEGQIFSTVRASVFVVEADEGHGSGFLVDRAGLIVTNDHVLGRTRYIAVSVDRERKYRAIIVTRDADRDIAIVRTHPDALAGLTPLPLSARDTPVSIGERVLAIGSPLSTRSATLTTGVVGKVDPDTITSDVNVNPGNSGGPLLNLRGEVIGVTTFGQQSVSGGPGISGIIRIHVAEKALAEARTAIGNEPPPSDLLPVLPLTPYPITALRSVVDTKVEPKNYHVEAGKMDVHFITPVLAFFLEHETAIKARQAQKKRAKGKAQTDPAADVYQWQADSGQWDAVVAVRAMPEIAMTGGSRFGRILGAAAGVSTPANYRFKTDFRAMKLLRDGVEVTPIHPGRTCAAVQEQAGLNRLGDVGCMGLYQYPADAFAPGASLELHVYSEDAPHAPTVCRLQPALVERVWHDFKAYFDIVQKGPE